MTWITEGTNIPTSIGAIFIAMTDYDGIPANHIVTFNVEILNQDNETMTTRTGDLIPHLTSTQIQNVINFLAAMRTKAETELLPE